jgi:hypothetical protein
VHWSAAEKAAIAQFEGVAVSVVGFIVAVKKQSGGSGEATNCHFNITNFVHTHVALVVSMKSIVSALGRRATESM